jgi:P27 family predicted phage terminase small subunit
MGERGPKPKPTFLRILEGNPGKHPMPPGEPQAPRVSSLPVPEWFDEDRAALWADVTHELALMNGLSRVDYQILVMYVDTIAECHRLSKKLIALKDSVMKYGPEGKKRNIKSIPYFHQLVAQKQLALKFAAQFGMTPSARARIVVLGDAKREEIDPFDVG